MFRQTNKSVEEVWKIVKRVKLETSLDLENPYRKIKLNCDSEVSDGLYSKDRNSLSVMKLLQREVEQELGIVVVDDYSSGLPHEDVPMKNIIGAAEMFIYLNTCPGRFDKVINSFGSGSFGSRSAEENVNEKWFKAWFTFYKDLFKSQSPNKIILTLNRMIKNKSPEAKNDRIRNQKLFEKVSSVLNLEYPNIHKTLPGVKTNISQVENQQILKISGKSNLLYTITHM